MPSRGRKFDSVSQGETLGFTEDKNFQPLIYNQTQKDRSG